MMDVYPSLLLDVYSSLLGGLIHINTESESGGPGGTWHSASCADADTQGVTI